MVLHKFKGAAVVFALVAVALGVWPMIVRAWTKSSGATCQNVFASITNENQTLIKGGYVKANGVIKTFVAGPASPGQVVTVSWAPPANFVGSVEAFVSLSGIHGIEDSVKIKADLDCAPAPSPSPSPSPSVSPSPSPEPTCEELDNCVEPSPTPSATPSATPAPTPGPEQPKEAPTSAPTAWSCPNPDTVKVAANAHILRKGPDAIAKWQATEGDKVNIYYKQVNSPVWQYSLRDVPNDGYEDDLHHLGGLDITFAIQQVNGCSGGPLTTPIVDGATSGWVLFR